MNKELREKQIYDYIVEYVKDKGFAPSIREICKGLSIASTSTVQGYIKSLSEKGFLFRENNKKRAIMPTANKSSINVPILGSIVAGEPLISYENIDSYFPLPVSYNQGDDIFALKVHGDSMIDAGIYENDLIIVKKQPLANNGDIVVAMVDDATTVKTYYLEEDCIKLLPANKKYEPIISKNVRIIGKVVGLHRMF